MNAKQNLIQHRWLVGSLCVWLLCGWVAQQPAPAKKARLTSATSVKLSQTNTPPTDSLKIDPETGLAMDKNLMLVKGQCTACHSSKLILQSHFDREKWAERIRWMQRTQKLWDLGESEPVILTYLTKYYGPVKTPFDGRRLPLGAPAWYRHGR